MKYMGSKNRIAQHILPIMLAYRRPDQYWVEPFVGGGNMIDKVSGNRIGADINKYLIALLKEMQKDNFSLPFVGEKEYQDIRNNKENYPDYIVGYAGFQLSFGAKWFGGYRRDKVGIRDYQNEAQQNLKSQQNMIKDIDFYCCDYMELNIPWHSIVYCDPPYKDTTKYKDNFDHIIFWQWCRDMVVKGHTVFVSEYNAPDDFECIWQKEIVSSLTKDTGRKKAVEKLFRYKYENL